ncbi:MAG: DUF4221 family protein [Roseivirga sp.]|nr:DUF4221 family protein [Roseivirga sp.]
MRGGEWLAAYNYLDHSISIINFSDRKYFKQVKLQGAGPDFVDGVRGIAYYREGNFILAGLKYITIINFDGKVLGRLRLNDSSSVLEGFDFSRGRLEVNRYSGLQYDAISGQVLLSAVQRGADGRFVRYIAAVNLANNKIDLIKVPRFVSRDKGESFGNISGFSFRRLNTGFVINPRYSSEVVLIGQGEPGTVYINSSITSNKAVAYNLNSDKYQSIIDHHNQSVEFYPIFQNYDQSYFFRIHKGPIGKPAEKEPFYLIIVNEDFTVREEMVFPEGYYISPIVSKEGVMFMAFNKHDDVLELVRYRF